MSAHDPLPGPEPELTPDPTTPDLATVPTPDAEPGATGGPASDAAPEPTPADVRRRLVERFEAWLDRMAAGEPPPPGIPAELLVDAEPAPAGSDLYSVVSGLTGLTGEIRLQGRAFKQLADVLSPLGELPAQFEQLSASLEPAQPAEDADVPLPAPKAMLDVLLDLRDRLARGLRDAEARAAQPVPRGWFGRTAPTDPSVFTAMRDGYALTLSRVTAALHQWDVEPVGQIGEPFDPRRMVAIDVRSGTAEPTGTVVEVNRTGCAVRGTVLTPAQVTVAR
jgi:hypothetical protein